MRKTAIYRGKEFKKYEIDSNTGLVYRKGNSQPLKAWDDQRGYLMITLMDDNNYAVNAKVHQISAHTFLGPQPLDKVVEHKDGNKYHNWISNLEYTSYRENVARAQVLIKGKVYLDSDTVDAIRDALQSGKSIAQVSKEFNLMYWIVRDIKSNKTYTHFN